MTRRTQYVVAMCGDLNRGEHMNCAVLAWDTLLGDTAPVTVLHLSDWSRVRGAFPDLNLDIQDDIGRRIAAIKTLADFRYTRGKIGPYTPFDFTEERGSTSSPEETCSAMAKYFLHQQV